MAKIKICGLRRTEDAEYVNTLEPEYCGMILTPGFKRSITRETAAEIASGLDAGIIRVGVFVNDEGAVIEKYVKSGIIQAVQLHGSESPEFARKLKKALFVPIIKAVKVTCEEDVLKAADYPADMVLFDNGTGTGESFDREIFRKAIKKYKGPEFFIAGGLNPSNVAGALEFDPSGVDVSGGVEKNGSKDFELMREFIRTVRSRG
ncbi:MAG: phosphoribosylanthranilate isomerase [Lachnospiraceae bacterium]|nr:phosphoribosylanthranilate isomerase [Lachnospiraceae bacterium]